MSHIIRQVEGDSTISVRLSGNRYCASCSRSIDIFCTRSTKILYYKMRLLDRHLRGTHARDFHFKALGKQEVFDLFARTKATIDIQHPRQTGLTMRCIEALGAKKKLITTNAQIKEYDFYREQNILVIDRHHPVVPAEFFNTAYEELPETIYRKYSLENWLHTVLS